MSIGEILSFDIVVNCADLFTNFLKLCKLCLGVCLFALRINRQYKEIAVSNFKEKLRGIFGRKKTEMMIDWSIFKRVGNELHTKLIFQCEPFGSFDILVVIDGPDVESIYDFQIEAFEYIQNNWPSIWGNVIPVFEELSNGFAYSEKSFSEHLKSDENYLLIYISNDDSEYKDGNWQLNYEIKMPSGGYCSLDLFLMDDQVTVSQPCY